MVMSQIQIKSQQAAKFILELAELSDRLATHGIVIGSVRAEYSGCGCWQLIARSCRQAVRFFWNGRDGHLTVAGAPARDGSGAERKNDPPPKWRKRMVKNFDRGSGDQPLRFVEEYLLRRSRMG